MTLDAARRRYIAAQERQILAHGDDLLAVNCEIIVNRLLDRSSDADEERLMKLTLELRNRAGFGDGPQLRMPLGPNDTVADYLAILVKPWELVKLRRRAAGAVWDGGGCLMLGGPAPPGGVYRMPDRPELAKVREETYGPDGERRLTR